MEPDVDMVEVEDGAGEENQDGVDASAKVEYVMEDEVGYGGDEIEEEGDDEVEYE